MARTTARVQDGVLVGYSWADTDTDGIAVGTEQWYAWLKDNQVFRFECPDGSFTARKEQRADTWYWYAYRRQQNILHKAYIGKAEDLTLVRLIEIAQAFKVVPAPANGNARKPGTKHHTPSWQLLDTLLVTKLTVPPMRPVLVERPRLKQRLAEGAKRKLTLIAGPAGSGKTTLLSNWLHDSTFPTAWVSLDANDNDPARFWAYMIAALQKLYPGIAEHVLTLLPSIHTVPMELVLTGFINAIATLPGELILVLDDYHMITAQPLHEALIFLLHHMPPQLHLIIASRSEPPLPTSRLRAQGHLTEVTATDLRYTYDESNAFLREVMGIQFSDEEVATLVERTEGWIVGLHLAALALQKRSALSDFAAEFHGNHHYILDYLTSEVFQAQPAHLQDFLLQTSMLERLSSPLCDAVTCCGKSHIQLKQLERGNVFLVPLDDKGEWYRYHHLFTEFLYERLRQLHADQLPALHSRAAQWYAKNGLLADAVKHALAADDVTYTIVLIEQAAQRMLTHHEVTTLLGWLEALPDSVVRSSPRLSLFYAWALFHTAQLETIRPRLQDAERALSSQHQRQDSHAIQEMRGEIAALSARVAAYQGDHAQSIALSEQALELLPENATRGEISLNLGIAHLSSGDMRAAWQAFTEARDVSQATGNLRTAMLATRYLGSLYVDQGRLHQAKEIYQQALDIAAKSGENALPPIGYMYVGMGEVLYELNDLKTAMHVLQEAIERGKRGGDVKIWLLGIFQLASIKRAQADWDGAYSLLRNAERLARQGNFTRGLSWLETERVLLELSQGNNKTTDHWVQAQGLSVDGNPDILSEYEYLVFARVLIAQEKPAMARKILLRLLRLAEETGQTGYAIAILTYMAVALEVQNERVQAIHTLERALSLAEPESYIRTFVDAGAVIETLLQKVRLDRQQEQDACNFSMQYVDKLLAAFVLDNPTPTTEDCARTSIQSGVEPLSARELEVLQLIAAGLSNQEIAHSLIVGINTIKTHSKNIYGKLAVHSRTQAIARAKALGLL